MDARVVIVGAGPVGMTLALQLAEYDVPCLIVDRKPRLEKIGSRAIVLARHALQIFRDLGCAEPMLERGIALARARTYFRSTELFCVEFADPAPGQIPRFINLQQTHTERSLYDRACDKRRLIDFAWSTELVAVAPHPRGVTLTTRTPHGERDLQCEYAVGCDGAHSRMRELLRIDFPGSSFEDRFMIADIRAELPFPNERRFFFDPPFNPRRQVLIHPQPDGEWRIDWQVPDGTDAEAERDSGRLEERIRKIIADADYELVWLTAYRFHQRCAARFFADRCFLAGDAAHLMAPFGARGMNGGVEDARNLGWKLALVLNGEASPALLNTYEEERRAAAEENIRVTSGTMRFMAPPTPVHRMARNLLLRASLSVRALRQYVDSGKLAEPAIYDDGDGLLGRLAPPDARPEGRLPTGFAVALVEDTAGGQHRLLLRPDGYVAAELDRDHDVERAVTAALMRQ